MLTQGFNIKLPWGYSIESRDPLFDPQVFKRKIGMSYTDAYRPPTRRGFWIAVTPAEKELLESVKVRVYPRECSDGTPYTDWVDKRDVPRSKKLLDEKGFLHDHSLVRVP